jgi:hypothetical protein
MFARLGNSLLALSLVLVFGAGSATSAKATGATGPIQLGGDDQNDHGYSVFVDHDENVTTPDIVSTVDGWKYISISLAKMLETEQRAGASNSIAVIGTNGTEAYVTGNGWTMNDGGVSCTTGSEARYDDNDTSDDSYCLMEVVKAEIDFDNGAEAAPTVTYYDTAEDVTALFDGLTAGTVNVAVVFFPGDGGTNDLGEDVFETASGSSYVTELEDEALATTVNTDPTDTTPMEQALIDSASDIAAFNAAGGGLLASGRKHYLSWLTTLLPEIGIETSPDSDVLGMTPDGAALWTGLTDEEISNNWHNHFVGDIGALKVLARGYEDPWTDTNADGMVSTGEAEPLMWDGPDATPSTADDAQTVVVIGGAAGEASFDPDLPSTNTSGDASSAWALLVAAIAAVAGVTLRIAEGKRRRA